MMENESIVVKKRDGRMDCIKGIAISLVVIGHILQSCYKDYSSSVIFNIIWTLQIPLFMIVSGYFAGGGGGFAFARFIKKLRCYLIPFCSCWLICELFIRGNYNLLVRMEYLVYHLESSLWYLLVLFELSCVHMVAVTIATKIHKNRIGIIKRLMIYTIAYGVCLMPFAGLALVMGISFLGSKFVLYYSIFYWLGYIWKTLSSIIADKPKRKKMQIEKILSIMMVVAFVVYFGLLSHFNIAEAGDGLNEIVIRFTASVSGIFLIIKTVYTTYKASNLCCKFLTFIGNYTLEIYYIHYMFIPYVAKIAYPVASLAGMVSMIFLYFIVLAICAVGIIFTKSSSVLSVLLFGKGGKNEKVS